MSILDTFYVLFKADTTDLKKGSAEAETILSKTQDKLKQTAKQSDMLGSSFLAAAKSAAGLLGGLLTIGTIVSGLKSAVSYVEEIGDASRKLNVDPTALDAWGHAVQRTGGSAREFQSSLESLATHLGTTNAIALQALPHLADSFSKLSKFRALQLGKHLGIDQSTIYLLQQGRREVESVIKQQKELGIVTQAQVEITRKYENALYDTGRVYSSFFRELALPLLPGITKALNYFIEHKGLIEGAFYGIGLAATVLAAPFIVANAEIILVAAGIAGLIGAFALLFEDFEKFKAGADSIAQYFTDQNIGDQLGKLVPQSIKNGYNTAKGYVSDQAIRGYGQSALNFVDRHPALAKITGRNSYDSNKTVTIQNLTINTQATDATGIAGAMLGGIYDQLTQANNFFDNSVVA